MTTPGTSRFRSPRARGVPVPSCPRPGQWSSPAQGTGTEWRSARSGDPGSNLGRCSWHLAAACPGGRSAPLSGLGRAHRPASPQRPPVGRRVHSGTRSGQSRLSRFRFRFPAFLLKRNKATAAGDATEVRRAERRPGPPDPRRGKRSPGRSRAPPCGSDTKLRVHAGHRDAGQRGS